MTTVENYADTIYNNKCLFTPYSTTAEEAKALADAASQNDVAWFYESLKKRENVNDIAVKLGQITEKTLDPDYHYIYAYARAIQLLA